MISKLRIKLKKSISSYIDLSMKGVIFGLLLFLIGQIKLVSNEIDIITDIILVLLTLYLIRLLYKKFIFKIKK
ncbi:hypothetical protein [Clostridium hydrogeniformans]|uniref:hypothetical protein n=1 Tax=Clostridium hydrogeniformans TaxID=349933 RepID=UPI000483A6AF|nr:hypothetical protein [Clostridium hydrogeniformans]